MKKTTLGLATIALATAFSLSACGTDEGELAKEYCDLLQDQVDAAESGDPEEVQDAAEAFQDWVEDNEDVEGDSDEFADAVEDECGDLAVPTVP